MKAKRVEDLGRIREIVFNLLDTESIFEQFSSRHTLDVFIEKYKDIENIEELHASIRYIGAKLNDILDIAIGDDVN